MYWECTAPNLGNEETYVNAPRHYFEQTLAMKNLKSLIFVGSYLFKITHTYIDLPQELSNERISQEIGERTYFRVYTYNLLTLNLLEKVLCRQGESPPKSQTAYNGVKEREKKRTRRKIIIKIALAFFQGRSKKNPWPDHSDLVQIATEKSYFDILLPRRGIIESIGGYKKSCGYEYLWIDCRVRSPLWYGHLNKW